MDELLARALEKIQDTFKIEPITLAEELRETAFPLRVMEIQCFNWKADRIRKIYAMRMKVKIPSLDILGMAIYPEPATDVPIFVFDLTCARKKVVTYINFIPLFRDEAYQKKYLDPLQQVHGKYGPFPPQKMPEWMRAYASPYTIYSMPDRPFLDKLKACSLDYLSVYLDIISAAQRIDDIAYREQVELAQKRYVDDLLTKDASQKMLAKLIGKQKTGRIFKEVLV
ncbi:MAG: hypothetical protein NTZ51_03825 [Proteobacteria bacterium]|nr:hypothetical protein [Pseudomonadota bacterium]